MFKQLKELFRQVLHRDVVVPSVLFDRHGDSVEERLKVATVALLLRLASSDGEIDPLELQTIVETLEQQFVLHPSEVRPLLEQGAGIAEDGKAERLLLREFDEDQRELIYALLLKIMHADHKVAREEEAVLRKLRNELHVTEDGIRRAEEMVERRRV